MGRESVRYRTKEEQQAKPRSEPEVSAQSTLSNQDAVHNKAISVRFQTEAQLNSKLEVFHRDSMRTLASKSGIVLSGFGGDASAFSYFGSSDSFTLLGASSNLSIEGRDRPQLPRRTGIKPMRGVPVLSGACNG